MNINMNMSMNMNMSVLAAKIYPLTHFSFLPAGMIGYVVCAERGPGP